MFVKYNEVADMTDPSKKYYVLGVDDFDYLIKQMGPANGVELRGLLAFMNLLATKYREYERQYRLQLTRHIIAQNKALMKFVEDLKSAIGVAEKSSSEFRTDVVKNVKSLTEMVIQHMLLCPSACDTMRTIGK